MIKDLILNYSQLSALTFPPELNINSHRISIKNNNIQNMEQTSYQNPDIALNERQILLWNSTSFNLMLTRVHMGANCPNPRSYDASHHSFETRCSKNGHSSCILYTPKHYSGGTLKETEEKFLKLAKNHGHAFTDGVKALYFRDLENSSVKSQRKLIVIQNQSTSSSQNLSTLQSLPQNNGTQ